MGIFRSKAERELRKRHKNMDGISSKLNVLANPQDLSLGDFIVTAARIENACGWPPEREFFWPYIFALGFGSLGYLWTAENVHLGKNYGSRQVAPTDNVLTWRWAARMARLLAERAICALEVTHAQGTECGAEAGVCLANIVKNSSVAVGQDLADVLRLSSYADTIAPFRAMSIPVYSTGVVAPYIAGAWGVKDIADTTIPQMLKDEGVGRWLTRETGTLPLLDTDPGERKFGGIALIIGDDPSDRTQGYIEAKFRGNEWPYGFDEGRHALLPLIYSVLVSGRFTVYGKHLHASRSSCLGQIDFHGSLPLDREYFWKFQPKAGRDVRLFVSQGSVAGGDRDNITILELDENETESCDIIKLVFAVNKAGLLSLLATDESTGREIAVRQVV